MTERDPLLKVSESFHSPLDARGTALHQFPRYRGHEEREATEFYDLAIHHVYQQYPDFDAANTNLLEAVALSPDFVAAYVALGDVTRYSGGDPAQARDWYLHAIDLDGDNAAALLGLVYATIAAGELPEAERRKAELERLHPRFMKYEKAERREAGATPDIVTYYSRRRNSQVAKSIGDSYYEAGQFGEAARCYADVISADSADTETRVALGLAHRRVGRYEAAEEAFHDTVDEAENLLFAGVLNYRLWFCDDLVIKFGDEPLSNIDRFAGPISSAWNNLGIIEMELGKYDDAEQAFSEVDLPEAENNMGVLLWSRGEPDTAKLALERSPYFESKFNLALILETEGRWREAATCWQSYLEGRGKACTGRPARLYTDTFAPDWAETAEKGWERCAEMAQ